MRTKTAVPRTATACPTRACRLLQTSPKGAAAWLVGPVVDVDARLCALVPAGIEEVLPGRVVVTLPGRVVVTSADDAVACASPFLALTVFATLSDPLAHAATSAIRSAARIAVRAVVVSPQKRRPGQPSTKAADRVAFLHRASEGVQGSVR